MREVRMILADLNCPVYSMKEAGISVDIVENGTTFAENAVIKAKAISALWDGIVLADDSGLEVDALDKAPGVYSARFMGEHTSYAVKNQYIIDQLEGLTGDQRRARFVCAIACAVKGREIKVTQGIVEGQIAYVPAGQNGFGYDPIFYLPEYGCTSAQIPLEKKNTISHRGRALAAMKEGIRRLLEEEQ